MDACAAERVQNGEKFIHAVKREVREEKRREKLGLCLVFELLFFLSDI